MHWEGGRECYMRGRRVLNNWVGMQSLEGGKKKIGFAGRKRGEED